MEPRQPALTGGCACGAVRFELDEPLAAAGYCHCTRCQRRSGAAASANGVVATGAPRIVRGEEHVREWQPPDGFAKLFCGRCGSALLSRSGDDPPRFGVRLGALDGDPGVRPSWRQHTRTAAAWEALPDDGLPRFEGPRPPGA